MSGSVTHGAETSRLLEIATQLDAQARRTEVCEEQGTSMLAVLQDAWAGPDCQSFEAGWHPSRQQLVEASSRLRQAAALLRDEAQAQDEASQGAPGAGAGGGPAGGGTKGDPAPPGGPRPEGDEDDDRSWWDKLRDKVLNRDQVLDVPNDEAPDDPGEDVDLPEGADRDDPMVQELMKTPRGREALQSMHDNGVVLVQDENQKGAYYDPGTNTIVLGKGYDDPSTVIHEANHAQWQAEGKVPDATEVSKDEYVSRMLDNETESETEEVYLAKERRLDGESVARSENEKAYDKAYTQAIEDGKTTDEADDAGRAAIKKRFADGEVVGSNSGKTYPEKYGDYWERVN